MIGYVFSLKLTSEMVRGDGALCTSGWMEDSLSHQGVSTRTGFLENPLIETGSVTDKRQSTRIHDLEENLRCKRSGGSGGSSQRGGLKL